MIRAANLTLLLVLSLRAFLDAERFNVRNYSEQALLSLDLTAEGNQHILQTISARNLENYSSSESLKKVVKDGNSIAGMSAANATEHIIVAHEEVALAPGAAEKIERLTPSAAEFMDAWEWAQQQTDSFGMWDDIKGIKVLYTALWYKVNSPAELLNIERAMKITWKLTDKNKNLVAALHEATKDSDAGSFAEFMPPKQEFHKVWAWAEGNHEYEDLNDTVEKLEVLYRVVWLKREKAGDLDAADKMLLSKVYPDALSPGMHPDAVYPNNSPMKRVIHILIQLCNGRLRK